MAEKSPMAPTKLHNEKIMHNIWPIMIFPPIVGSRSHRLSEIIFAKKRYTLYRSTRQNYSFPRSREAAKPRPHVHLATRATTQVRCTFFTFFIFFLNLTPLLNPKSPACRSLSIFQIFNIFLLCLYRPWGCTFSLL